MAPTQGTMDGAAHEVDASQQTVQPTSAPARAGEAAGFPRRFSGDLYFVEKVVKRGGEAEGFEIDVRFPQLEGSMEPRVRKFNRGVEHTVHELYKWSDNVKPMAKKPRDLPGTESTTVTFEIERAQPEDIISIEFGTLWYSQGAAHPGYTYSSLNYEFATARWLRLSDLFKKDSGYLRVIADTCRSELKSLLASHEAWSSIYNSALEPKPKNYSAWTIVDEGIQFGFDRCAVADCSQGPVSVIVPFSVLKPHIDPKGPIAKYIP